jgi:hypothetical protein
MRRIHQLGNLGAFIPVSPALAFILSTAGPLSSSAEVEEGPRAVVVTMTCCDWNHHDIGCSLD